MSSQEKTIAGTFSSLLFIGVLVFPKFVLLKLGLLCGGGLTPYCKLLFFNECFVIQCKILIIKCIMCRI